MLLKTCYSLQFSDNDSYCLDYSYQDNWELTDAPPNKNLEEAAKQFVGYDMDADNLRDYEIGIRSFIAGAEWQKRQMGEQAREQLSKTDITLANMVAFDEGLQLGRRLERQNMFKDAVEGYVNYYEDSGGILMLEAQVGCPYHNGDKVKIIIVKENENETQ